jgi:hypothetical protein
VVSKMLRAQDWTHTLCVADPSRLVIAYPT